MPGVTGRPPITNYPGTNDPTAGPDTDADAAPDAVDDPRWLDALALAIGAEPEAAGLKPESAEHALPPPARG
jgi:hypothetical protein